MSEDPKPKRPRRRRRRGRGGNPPGGPSDGGQSDSAAGAGAPREGSERGAKRRRSNRKPSRSDGPSGGDDGGRPGRRRRRRRGPRDGADDNGPQDNAASGRGRSVAEDDASSRDIDDGWDLPAAADADSQRHPKAAPAALSQAVDGAVHDAVDDAVDGAMDDAVDDAVDEREPWGDDADAPTPDIRLVADLPTNPPGDDLDPATAYLDGTLQTAAGADEGDGAAVASRDELHADIDDTPVRDVVGIKFAPAGRIYEYDADGADLAVGSDVVVESERGTRVGTVAIAIVRRPHASGKLKKVVRPANEQDNLILDSNRERAAEALAMAREAARKKRIQAKIFRAELSFGGTKLVIYYSSEDRVDLRDVQNQLARKLDCRVELRQTGVRDAAKLIGGIGSCGRELCCSTFLPAFAPVSIKMAKDQNMVLNPTKVSGQCGRLKCCLVYEQETYASMRKGLPKMGKRVITDDGEGRVVEVDVLRQRIRVSLGPGDFRVYPADQVKRKFPPQEQKQQKQPADAGEREPGEQS